MDQAIATEKRFNQIANFEINTAKKIEQKTRQDRFNSIKREQEESLIARRKELAKLYNDEMDAWTEEILSRTETYEEKKKRIMDRAHALRDAREKERQDFVRERLEKQWRDGLDEARAKDSAAKNFQVKQEVLGQISEKIRLKQELTKEEDLRVQEWKKQLDELEQLEQKKEEMRKQADQRLLEGLRAQMAELEERKRQLNYKSRLEDEEELRNIRAALEQEEEDQRRRQEEGRKRGEEIRNFNSSQRAATEEEKRVRREQERLLLEYALAKEREAAALEDQKREMNKKASSEYRRYLEEQMVRDAEDTALVDKMRLMEEEKAWKARDDALRAREEARRNLMNVVDQERQQQIRARYEAEENEKKEQAAWAERFLEEARTGVQKEKMEAARRRLIAKANAGDLSAQMNAHREREEALKQEAYLETKLAQYKERQQQQKLEALYSNQYRK